MVTEENIKDSDDVKNCEENHGKNENIREKLLYTINDIPPWYLCLLLGFQHYITMIGSIITKPLIIMPKLCIPDTDPARSYIIATTIFVSGLSTFIQTTFGIRLPIVQGTSSSFLIPIFAILNLPKWQCPTFNSTDNITNVDVTGVWQSRMLEIQGAIITASLIEILIGMTGIIGIILRWVTPLAIVPSVSLVGFSFFQIASKRAGQSWLVSGITIIVMIIFSQYLINTKVPIPAYNKTKNLHFKRLKIFGFFAVLLAMAIVWILCGILTAADAFPEGHAGRTDKGMKLIRDSSWFYIPYPFQWGIPTITLSSVLALFIAIIASMVDSIGDYYACASMCEAPLPPTHAMNRGIFMEGVGCVLSGIFGTGCGLTSYSTNIGAIGITRVGSRRVVQYTAFILMLSSFVLKFSTLFAAIPTPIIDGIICTVFGIIISVGLSPLQYVDLNSPRNLFILGFSIFMGLVIPQYLDDNPDAIQLGNNSLNQIITVLLQTGMFVGGFIGFTLDNTVPGTDEERGVIKWLEQCSHKEGDDGVKCYDIALLNKLPFRKYIPIFPGYSEDVYFSMFKKRNL